MTSGETGGETAARRARDGGETIARRVRDNGETAAKLLNGIWYFRVSKDTPATWSELSPSEKQRAAKEKRTKGRVSRYKVVKKKKRN